MGTVFRGMAHEIPVSAIPLLDCKFMKEKEVERPNACSPFMNTVLTKT